MTADKLPAGQGLGVNSVPVEATTYHAIAIEDQRRELEAASLGRWAAEAKPPLPPGASLPPLPANSPWATGDGLGVAAAVDINGSDPSGTLKNRGID
jgi:hypothetical protein